MKQNLTKISGKSIRLWQLFVIIVLVATFAATSFAASPNLVAAFLVKGKVGLKWQAMEGISEFSIYRKSADSDYQKIGTIDDDHYFDTDLVPGAVYTYKISVIDANGAELFSGEKTVTIPGVQAGEFHPPSWSGLRIEQDKIYLNWDPVPGAIAYNVLRSTTPGSGHVVIGNSQTSKWADKDGLQKGQTYYYVVTAMDAEFQETEQSKERSIKFGMSREELDELEAAENKIELEPVKLTQLFEITEAGSNGAMNQPADIFVNSRGHIYVTDALNGKIHCFDSSGKYLFSFGEKMDKRDIDNPPPSTFLIPFTLFIDRQDQVYVSDIDRHDIQVFTPDGEFIRRIQVDVGEGNNPLRPNGIHVLDDGRLVLTDTGNHRFLIVDQNGKILLAKGERGGEPGQFNFPDELTVAPDNTIYIVDVINCRVQKFDLDGNFIQLFGEVGQSAGTFARPKAITVDGTGRIWVSDGMSSVIQSFTPEGEVKSALGTLEDESIKFVTPRGIFFDGDRFYVVNRVPHRVVVYKIG